MKFRRKKSIMIIFSTGIYCGSCFYIKFFFFLKENSLYSNKVSKFTALRNLGKFLPIAVNNVFFSIFSTSLLLPYLNHYNENIVISIDDWFKILTD